MDRINKVFSLLLVVILSVSSLIMVESANAQTLPKTPEFTLRFVVHPYDVAPTTSIDPYTGKTIVTQEGYHSENKSIEVVIKNQYFVPYKDSSGNNIGLMYNIRWKGHFDTTNTWSYFAGTANRQEYTSDYLRPSNAEYSTWVATLSLDEWEKRIVNYNYIIALPTEGQIDFQVEALIGYSSLITGQSIPLGATSLYEFTGITSDWSNTQTIRIPDGSVSISTSTSPTPNPTPTPTVAEFPTIAVFLLLISLVSVAVIIGSGKTRRTL